jgi:hypothetical protein
MERLEWNEVSGRTVNRARWLTPRFTQVLSLTEDSRRWQSMYPARYGFRPPYTISYPSGSP